MPVARRVLIITLLSFAACNTGCGSRKLETGYAYAPLGASPVQRRAYYAGAYSPEARNAMMSQDNEATGTTNHTPSGPRR